jgi:CHAD domain-containing protein
VSPFELSPTRSLPREVLRLEGEALERATNELRAKDRDVNERVHETRRQLKQLRALLRLVSPGLGKVQRAKDTQLKRAARALASSRDAAALHEALSELLERQPTSERPRLDLHANAFRQLLPAVAGADASGIADALTVLDNLATLPASPRDSIDWSTLRRGFRRTYARARRELAVSLEHPDSERLHRLRTQVKRHQHQLDLLTPLWPKVVGARRREVSRLGELLGREHDLSRLAAELEKAPVSDETRAVMSSLTTERRQRLRAEALELARRAFAEPPRRIAARFRRYLEIWRDEADPAQETGRRAPISASSVSSDSERPLTPTAPTVSPSAVTMGTPPPHVT